ncbi:hypothetical protein HWV62_37376 [Athelia sp. TMB]|nr:hypothetical protein HWV62_37376 [Athelia sp. TMB]
MALQDPTSYLLAKRTLLVESHPQRGGLLTNPSAWDGRIPDSKAKTLIQISGPEHTRRRRPWNRAFNSEALKGYEEIIEKRANQLMETLSCQVGATNLAQWISFFTFDFMSDMASVPYLFQYFAGINESLSLRFGGGSEMLREGDSQGVWSALDNSSLLSTALGHSPWLGPYYNILPIGTDKRRFRDFCVERAKSRIAQGSMTKDVFHHFLNESGTEANPPSMLEVVQDSGLVIIAGSDTTSTVLSSLFWFIMTNPTTYSRLQAEIDSVFPPGEDALDVAKHIHMDYLNAVINETLRLFPPVLSGSQRVVERGGGAATFGSYIIPEGTAVFSHFFSIQRDARYFSPLPETFWPDRWLPQPDRTSPFGPAYKGSLDVVTDRTAFTPFSFGPSICVGKSLALQELRMVVCLMLQTFDMRLAEGYDAQRWEKEMEDRLISHTGELPVVLTRRKN